MTAVTIAARELRERSRLFLICAALAVLPFVAGMLPSARADREGVITTAGSYIALAMALGTALTLGATTVVRDLIERRLSFYFSKPVSTAAIWFGKAAAALIASLACFAIVALPSALLVNGWPGPGMWMLDASQLIGLTVAGVVVLFFAGHFLASITRSRSVLIGLDFVLAATAGVVLALIARPLLAGAAMELTGALTSGFAAALLIAMIVAPVYQLERGRTDIRRGHAALARFFWPVIYAVILGIGAYVLWVVSAAPRDLTSVLFLRQSPRGEQVLTGGGTRGRGDYHAAFLVEGDGQWRRVPMAPWTDVNFSRDGSEMVWTEPVGIKPAGQVELHTKRGGASGIRVSSFVATALSDDGSRVAVGKGNLVSVYATSGGRLLASAAGFNSSMHHTMFFVTSDVVRIIEVSYSLRPAPMRVFELDVPRKKLTKTGELVVGASSPFGASPDGSRLLLRRLRRVVDGRTLATIEQLPEREAFTVLLSDGRVAETVREGERSRLRIYGGPEVVLPIAISSVVGELADGTLLVRGTRRIGWSPTGAERTMFVVDPVKGAIVQTVAQVKGPEPNWSDPRLPRYETGRLAGIDKEGKLVWWDAKTGRTEPAP